MSKKLRRWDIECTGIGDDVDMVERPKGNYVLMEDYARLKAEVERLTAEVSFDKRVQLHVDKLVAEFTQCQVERLQAEVERLRKAGDAMAETILKDCIHKNDIAALKWYAAKEGKQP